MKITLNERIIMKKLLLTLATIGLTLSVFGQRGANRFPAEKASGWLKRNSERRLWSRVRTGRAYRHIGRCNILLAFESARIKNFR